MIAYIEFSPYLVRFKGKRTTVPGRARGQVQSRPGSDVHILQQIERVRAGHEKDGPEAAQQRQRTPHSATTRICSLQILVGGLKINYYCGKYISFRIFP